MQPIEVIDDLSLIKHLGDGSFGDVYLSTKKGCKEIFATKKFNKYMMDEDYKKYLKNEIHILKILNKLKHPNIYKLIDIKENKLNYYLVLEYVNGGCLSECLEKYQKKNNNSSFSEEIVQHLMRQIIDAFKYIHGKSIIHRDIKLENIMVNFSNDNDKKNLNLLKAQVKIIDFGLAVEGMGQTVLGTPKTMPPLILKKFVNSTASKIIKTDYYDEKLDIWSIGAVCYNMLIGKPIFDSYSLKDLLKKVELGNYVVPLTISKEILSFLNSMLQYESEKRLGAAELAKHPFLTKNVRDFQKIDRNQFAKKIDNKGLNINIQKNQTIWSLFNESNISKIQMQKSKSLNSTMNNSSGYQSFISNNSNMSNTHNTPYELQYRRMPNSGPLLFSFYGQPMNVSNHNIRNNPNMQNQNIGINQNQQNGVNHSNKHNLNIKNNNNNNNNFIFNNNNFYGNNDFNSSNTFNNNNISNNNTGFSVNSNNKYQSIDNDDTINGQNCRII